MVREPPCWRQVKWEGAINTQMGVFSFTTHTHTHTQTVTLLSLVFALFFSLTCTFWIKDERGKYLSCVAVAAGPSDVSTARCATCRSAKGSFAKRLHIEQQGEVCTSTPLFHLNNDGSKKQTDDPIVFKDNESIYRRRGKTCLVELRKQKGRIKIVTWISKM